MPTVAHRGDTERDGDVYSSADDSPLFVSDLLGSAFRTILDLNMKLLLLMFVVFNHRHPTHKPIKKTSLRDIMHSSYYHITHNSKRQQHQCE